MRRLCLLLLPCLVAGCATTAPMREGPPDPAARQAQIETIVRISEQVVPNPAFVQGEVWEAFLTQLRSPQMVTLDDRQFAAAFNRAAKDLPFTHYTLSLTGEQARGEAGESVQFSELRPDTVLLRVARFDASAAAMERALERIRAGRYARLIVDLRGNPGGSFPSAVALGRFLSQGEVDAGVYLTRQWFARHGDYPDAAQIAAIPVLRELDLATFREQLRREGAMRMILPGHSDPVFDGIVVILADRHTASASEPLVHLLRESGTATVIGETTAGAMLSAERIRVGGRLALFVPVADFLLSDGKRLDRVGVSPDISVPSAQALELALEWLDTQASH